MDIKLSSIKDIQHANSEIDEEINIESFSKNDIAIIGVAGRFGEAKDINELWSALEEGRDCIRKFPDRRITFSSDYSENKNKTYSAEFIDAAYLDEIDMFDYNMFSITSTEANLIDPNQRIFLQTAFEAIEDAGYGNNKLSKTRTGVFVGFSNDFSDEYRNIVNEYKPELSNISIPGNIKSIIASRISYFLDLKGPSMIIDTACSSSLVAIHLACQSLKNKECSMALAGGIKINITPMKKNERDEVGIASSDGRTKTFDDSANGTGSGEGVGVVVLKPLDKAMVDRDNIYAVIKGSAINQDGSSVGITAPNSLAQEDVIVSAWQNARINPETISYIEAHGTATKLGDPVEVTGISKAFARYTHKKQFCAVGSVKTNLGHLDSASGIAGFMKLVLALKHKKIPPNIHFRKSNKEISFEKSPVFVNDKLKEWTVNGVKRICGINSFGLSGTNCHIVLEEWDNVIKNEDNNNWGIDIFTLSAKNEECLRESIKKYCEFLGNGHALSLSDMCFTSNTGRGHYEYRLAFLVKNLKDLTNKLEKVRNQVLDEVDKEQVYYGKNKIISDKTKSKKTWEITHDDKSALTEESDSIIDKIHNGNILWKEDTLSKICKLYVSGADVNWNKIYKDSSRRRVSIPVYPLAKESCWVDMRSNNYLKINKKGKQVNHPLFNNILLESLDLKVYLSYFNVETYWVLNEHQISGNYVMPGTTYIEMAREAALDIFKEDNIELRNIVFISPLIVEKGETKEVNTILKYSINEIEFSVVSKTSDHTDWVKHVEGVIARVKQKENIKLNIEEIKHRCINKKEVDFENIPMDVLGAGPRWRCLKNIYSSDDEILTYLELPKVFEGDLMEYYLHPSLLDSAVNSANGNIVDSFHLPLSYKCFKIHGPTPMKIFSYFRKKDRIPNNNETATFDIQLCDKDGNIFGEVEEYTIKKVHQLNLKQNSIKKRNEMMYKVNWEKRSLDLDNCKEDEKCILAFNNGTNFGNMILSNFKRDGIRVIEVIKGLTYKKINDNKYEINTETNDYLKLVDDLKYTEFSKIIHLFSVDNSKEFENTRELEISLHEGLYSIYYLIKSLTEKRIKHMLDLVLISDYVNEVKGNESRINPHNAALQGIGKVIEQEHLNVKCRFIDIDSYTSPEIIYRELKSNKQSYLVAYRENERYIEEIDIVDAELNKNDKFVPKENGVYIITGGTGGIGLEIARNFSSKNKVNLLLINRSSFPLEEEWDTILNDSKDNKLIKKISIMKEIQASGSNMEFVKGDVSNYDDMNVIFKNVRKKYKKINGLVHSAGVAGNGFLLKKDFNNFKDVIYPKIHGTWILNKLTEKDNLDFFIMFSSVTSLFGAPGQSDYTAANSYLDTFAYYRNRQAKNTYTINWSAWNETGMAFDFGVHNEEGVFKSLSSSVALESFECLIGSDLRRLIVGELDTSLIENNKGKFHVEFSNNIKKQIENNLNLIALKKSVRNIDEIEILIVGKDENEISQTEKKVSQIWGKVLGKDNVHLYDTFNDMGGDSILAIHLLKQMNEVFPNVLDIADIFTYSTIIEMSDYIDSKIKPKIDVRKEVNEDLDGDFVGNLDGILSKLAKGQISADEAEQLL